MKTGTPGDARRARAGTGTRASQTHLLDTVLAAASDALFMLDDQWRLTYANPKAEQLWGRRRDELLGRPFLDCFPEMAHSEPWAKYRQAMDRNEPVEFESWCPITGGWAAVSACPTPQGLSIHFHDISERRRAEQMVQLFVDAGAALAGSLDYAATLKNVAELMVPQWADWCVVDLFDEAGRPQNVAVAHSDPQKVELVREMRRVYPPRLTDEIGAGRVTRTGAAQCVPEIDDALLRDLAKDERHLRLLRGLGLRSGLVVPMWARGRTIGALTLVAAETPRRFSEADLPYVEEVARRCATAIEFARLYAEAQCEIAQRRDAERALRASEGRERQRAAELEAVMDAVPAVVFLAHDPRGDRITGSRAAHEFLRLPRGANLSRSAEAAERPTHFRVLERGVETPPEDLPVQRAARGEEVRDTEMEVRFDDGTVRHLLGHATPLHDEAGEPRGAVAALLDISDRKRVEEALRASEARERARAWAFEAVVELGQTALAGEALEALFDRAVVLAARTLDNEMGKILELKPGGEELLLRAGVGWHEGLVGHARVNAGLGSHAGYTLRSNEPVIVEDLASERRFTGSPLLREHGVVSGMSVVIAGSDGKPWGVLGTHSTRRRRFTQDDVNFLQSVANVLADAIARKCAEDGLERLNETLERRVAERTAEAEGRAEQLRQMAVELTHTEQRERRKLARMLHDDHQQLLVAAKMQARMLKDAEDAGQRAAAVDRLTEVVDEAIDSSRSLSYELSPSSLQTDGLVAALEALVERKQERYGLTLHVDADPDAEPTHETLRVMLFQLVRELLLNVLKHAETDQAWVALARDARGRIELTVTDRGRGFAPDAVDAASDREEAGLGLSGMRERLTLVGGRMEVDTAPGKGTRVTLRVPIDAGAHGGASAAGTVGRVEADAG